MNKIIVLNLERSIKRRKLLEDQFNKIGIKDYLFFPAFDGERVINGSFGGNIIYGFGSGRKFQITEIACTLGHLAILKHAQMMDYDNIIVLEDDVALCEDWNKRIERLSENLPSDWEYVYLSGHSDYVTLPFVEAETLMPAPKMVGAFSYMVNKRAYRKIAEFCTSMITTYDDMIMAMIAEGKLCGYVILPFITYHYEHTSYKYFKNKLTLYVKNS